MREVAELSDLPEAGTLTVLMATTILAAYHSCEPSTLSAYDHRARQLFANLRCCPWCDRSPVCRRVLCRDGVERLGSFCLWSCPANRALRLRCSRRCHVLRLIALLSLGHPLGAGPAPCGTSRLCFSGSFHKKSPAQPRRGCGPGGRDCLRVLPKKRRSPLGAGHTRALREGCPE